MDASSLEAKSLLKEKTIKECFAEDDMDNEMEEEEEGGGDSYADDEKKKHVSGRRGPGAGGVSPPICVVENCRADLTDARRYHRRHKVCEFHSKAAVVMVAGLRQRFCQQCSRFHELSEFDETRRSCRRRLAGHNERRRKGTVETTSDGRQQISLQGNTPYKRSQIK